MPLSFSPNVENHNNHTRQSTGARSVLKAFLELLKIQGSQIQHGSQGAAVVDITLCCRFVISLLSPFMYFCLHENTDMLCLYPACIQAGMTPTGIHVTVTGKSDFKDNNVGGGVEMDDRNGEEEEEEEGDDNEFVDLLDVLGLLDREDDDEEMLEALD
jgi:hypothetical protein